MIGRTTRKRFWLAAIFGLLVFAYTLRQARMERLVQNMGEINLFWAFLALAASALSYICIGIVLQRLLRGVGHPLSFSSSFKISLLSCTMNYLMAVGGLSGVAAKVSLDSR